MALGERTKKLDLGRKQKLASLVPDWWLGLEWPISLCYDENVQIEQIGSNRRKMNSE